MAQRHTIHSLQLNGASALKLGALPSGGHAIDYTMAGPDSGGPYNEVRFIQQQAEKFDAVTTALSSILDNLGLVTPTCIGAGKTYTSIDLYGRALDTCGTDGTKAGSTHRKASSSLARLVVSSISASANGDVAVTLMGHLLSADGDAAPSATVYNVAIPTGMIVSEAFKLHAVQLANLTLSASHITQLTIDTGLAVTPEFGVKQYAQELTLTKTAPTLTIDTEDTSILDASVFPATGKKATHANSLIEFQKRDASTGGLVAAATEEHVNMTVEGFCRVSPISGSGSNKATAQIICECTGLAGTPPLTATADVALTL